MARNEAATPRVFPRYPPIRVHLIPPRRKRLRQCSSRGARSTAWRASPYGRIQAWFPPWFGHARRRDVETRCNATQAEESARVSPRSWLGANALTMSQRNPTSIGIYFWWMSHRSARLLVRRRTVVLVCLVALVWCQMSAFAHAGSMTVAQVEADPSAGQMTFMPSCNDVDGDGPESDTPCPTSEAAPDWSKFGALHALPPGNFLALVPDSRRGFAGPVHYGLPRGRAPPRAQFCCWLI